MKTSISSIALAVIGIASLSFAIPMSVARAQQAGAGVVQDPPSSGFAQPANPGQNFGSGQAQPGFPPQNPFGGQPPQPFQNGAGAQMRGAGMGGSATMVADGDSLYILMGNRLFKVSKGDLRVTKEGMLPIGQPMQPGQQGGNGFAAPGAAGPRGRGAGGAAGAPPNSGGRGGGDQAK